MDEISDEPIGRVDDEPEPEPFPDTDEVPTDA